MAYAYLAPALGLSGIGAFAFAGAVGGAFAGLTGAGMSGGNLWQGMLLGMVGGAVGGGVYSAVGGGLEGVLAGAFAGGFVAGGLGTAFNGGNFFQNAFVGGVTSSIMAGVTYGVAKGAQWLWQKWNAMPGTAEAQAKLERARAPAEADTRLAFHDGKAEKIDKNTLSAPAAGDPKMGELMGSCKPGDCTPPAPSTPSAPSPPARSFPPEVWPHGFCDSPGGCTFQGQKYPYGEDIPPPQPKPYYLS